MNLLISFFILAGAIVYASTKLAKFSDVIMLRTAIGAAAIGGILMAVATSLPEFTTSLASVVIGNPELAVGNVLGSNLFNVTLLIIIDIILIKKTFLNKISPSIYKGNIYIIIIYIFIIIGLSTSIDLSIGRFSLITFLILITYLLGIKFIASHNDEFNEEPEEHEMSLKKAIIGFIISVIIIFIASIFMTIVADKMVTVYGLSSSFVGAFFIGISTSLPEVVSVLALILMGRYTIAIGVIIGSNLFNFLVLVFTDLLYYEPLFTINSIDFISLALIGLIVNIIFVYVLYRNNNKNLFTYLLPSLIIFSLYLFLGIFMFL